MPWMMSSTIWKLMMLPPLELQHQCTCYQENQSPGVKMVLSGEGSMRSLVDICILPMLQVLKNSMKNVSRELRTCIMLIVLEPTNPPWLGDWKPEFHSWINNFGSLYEHQPRR